MRQVESAPWGSWRLGKSGGVGSARSGMLMFQKIEMWSSSSMQHEINMLKFMFGSSRGFHALHSYSCMCIYINIVYQRKCRWTFQVLKHPGPKQGGVEEICIHTGTTLAPWWWSSILHLFSQPGNLPECSSTSALQNYVFFFLLRGGPGPRFLDPFTSSPLDQPSLAAVEFLREISRL